MDKGDVLSALLGAVARGEAKMDVVKVEERNSGESPPKRDKALQARVLKDMQDAVTRKNPFVVGDLVEQIPAYNSYRFPDAGYLALVVDVFEPLNIQQRVRRGRSEGPTAREDMVILCAVGDGETERWVEFSVESWRFQAYTGPVE